MPMPKMITVHDLMFRDARGRVWVFTLVESTGQVISKSVDKVSVLGTLPSLEDFLAQNHYCLMPDDAFMPYWNLAEHSETFAGLKRH
jgi:hypothetical protein